MQKGIDMYYGWAHLQAGKRMHAFELQHGAGQILQQYCGALRWSHASMQACICCHLGNHHQL